MARHKFVLHKNPSEIPEISFLHVISSKLLLNCQSYLINENSLNWVGSISREIYNKIIYSWVGRAK